MKGILKPVLAAGLVVTLIVAIIGWQAYLKAKEENRNLAARLALAEQNGSTGSNPASEADDMARLKRDNQDLLRLRNEISQLQNQAPELERLRHENQRLRESLEAERIKAEAQWSGWVLFVRTNGVKPEDVSFLLQALTNEATPVRLEATKALRNIGLQRMLDTNLTPQLEAELRTAAITAVPGLVTALKDPDEMVRGNAVITLGFLHERADIAIPALVEAFNDERNRIALSAAKSLGRYQADGRGAIPALMEAARGPDAERRAAAITALKQIDPETVKRAGLE